MHQKSSPTTRWGHATAEHDLSIPDQHRQAERYCETKGWQIVAEYVEPGQSATDDKRPEFQRMMDAALHGGSPFDVVLVQSFSRFFRDQFQLEFYVRKLAKAEVRLISITQDLGDDPMSNMIRQIMALFDEYQSKEDAKHVLRAMKENARQGFWNGALPPIGYRTIEAEKRGTKIKKKLEIDPIQADTIRLIYRLALRDQLLAVLGGLKPCTITIEACTGAFCWARKFEELGHRVKIVSPQYAEPFVRGQSEAGKKTIR